MGYFGEATYHGRDGKFTGEKGAHTITKNGERFKVVRQLRRIKPTKMKPDLDLDDEKPAPKPSKRTTFEHIEAAKDKAALVMILSHSDRWVTVSSIVPEPIEEAGLTAAERKAGRVDARKAGMKEVLGFLAQGKDVVVSKKVFRKVPEVLAKHGIYIRSFWAGPRRNWEGVALITKDKEKLDSLRTFLQQVK